MGQLKGCCVYVFIESNKRVEHMSISVGEIVKKLANYLTFSSTVKKISLVKTSHLM